jgi:hypothetical protein
MRTCSDMSAWERRLLTPNAAADRFDLQAGVLSGFYRSAHGLAHEGGYFDAALLDVNYDGTRAPWF